MTSQEKFINQLEHELAWERMVVIPDLEWRMNVLIDILDKHGIDHPDFNKFEYPCNEGDLPF
jgi:hypothetical protein